MLSQLSRERWQAKAPAPHWISPSWTRSWPARDAAKRRPSSCYRPSRTTIASPLLPPRPHPPPPPPPPPPAPRRRRHAPPPPRGGGGGGRAGGEVAIVVLDG